VEGVVNPSLHLAYDLPMLLDSIGTREEPE
jgi:hypothetical protein